MTLARQGLKDDDPVAYGILTRFEWTTEDIASVMTDIEGACPKKKPQRHGSALTAIRSMPGSGSIIPFRETAPGLGSRRSPLSVSLTGFTQ